MSNKLQLKKPALPKYRVYIAEEAGALLVRHGKPTTSLKKALEIVAKCAPVIYWEVRSFFNGVERYVHLNRSKP